MTKAAIKLGNSPATLRLETLHEAQCAQIMHIGPYKDEEPPIAKIHNQFIPDHGLIENGLHHEIYISDPRKTASEKLRTVLRQPVRARETA
ncbi:MAG: GyrI-like domain-containing protein [Yoonia sp.]